MATALQIISNDIYALRDTFESVATDRNALFDREAQYAVQLLEGNDYLLKTAMNNKGSVLAAVTNVAAIGVSLNPALKLAYLVPRKNKVCLDISYMGLMHLAMLSGSIKWVKAEVVREKDRFELDGYEAPPQHVYQPFGDRGQIVGAYVVVKTDDGAFLTHAMAIADVYAIRERSESWKKDQSGPWKTDPAEMIKKTVVKQAYKYWPKVSNQLKEAIQILNVDNGEGIDFDNKPKIDPEIQERMLRDARGCRNKLELGQLWKKTVAELRPIGDMVAYNAIKAEFTSLGESLPAAQAEAEDVHIIENGAEAQAPAKADRSSLSAPQLELLADIESACDEGIEAFLSMYDALSKSTKAKIEAIPGLYQELRAKAEAVGGAE